MLAFLVAARDFLIAAALAWVGVTMEARVSHENACATTEACESE
jgi:hypothetical protein